MYTKDEFSRPDLVEDILYDYRKADTFYHYGIGAPSLLQQGIVVATQTRSSI